MGQSWPLFVYFHYFLYTISIIEILKSVDGVLVPQDGRRRQNHRAMAATHFEKYFTIIIYKSRAVLSWKLNLHITTLESLFTIIEYLKISIYIKQKRSSLLVKQKRSILFSSNQPIYQHSTIVIYESRVVLTGKLRRVLLQIRKLR